MSLYLIMWPTTGLNISFTKYLGTAIKDLLHVFKGHALYVQNNFQPHMRILVDEDEGCENRCQYIFNHFLISFCKTSKTWERNLNIIGLGGSGRDYISVEQGSSSYIIILACCLVPPLKADKIFMRIFQALKGNLKMRTLQGHSPGLDCSPSPPSTSDLTAS